MSIDNKKHKSLIGSVVSNNMDKTISVLIQKKVKHPLYKKYIRRSAKLLAHDESNVCNIGDKVLIEESRPISKNKAWCLKKVIAVAD